MPMKPRKKVLSMTCRWQNRQWGIRDLHKLTWVSSKRVASMFGEIMEAMLRNGVGVRLVAWWVSFLGL